MTIPSDLSSLRLAVTPPGPLYPPMLPSEVITRWQGIGPGVGFAPHAVATARYALGFPTRSASFLYVITCPLGILAISLQTAC